MSPTQQRAVALKIAPARSGAALDEVKAPGRIAADQDHFAFINPRAPGVVRTVAVNIGQEVRAGDVLATIDSPEVGRARLELRTQGQLLAVAREQARWQAEIHANTVELVEGLKRGDEPDAIQWRLAGRPVGAGRDRLMSAYAQYRLASTAFERNQALMKSDAVSLSQYQQVRAAYEAAAGSYQALLDSTEYEAKMADLKAQQSLHQAETALDIARERLKILGVREDATIAGPEARPSLADRESEAVPAGDASLSTYELVAPFDGTILDRTLVVPGVSVYPADHLFTIADLSTVWVEVSVSEADFDELARAPEDEVRFESPAYPDRGFGGRVIYRGDLVDEASRSVKLLAAAPNPERLLKPGMFVEAIIRCQGDRGAALVPDSAVVAAGQGSFVFVRAGHGHFERRPVVAGGNCGGEVAVLRGLDPGEEVVVEGASSLEAVADSAADGGAG
jgi:RND family efflux transporter MFP subunit